MSIERVVVEVRYPPHAEPRSWLLNTANDCCRECERPFGDSECIVLETEPGHMDFLCSWECVLSYAAAVVTLEPDLEPHGRRHAISVEGVA